MFKGEMKVIKSTMKKKDSLKIPFKKIKKTRLKVIASKNKSQ
jgi:hypothetical protein